MSRLSSWQLGEAAALPSQAITRDPDLYYAGVGVGAPRHRGAGRRLLLQRGLGAHSILPPYFYLLPPATPAREQWLDKFPNNLSRNMEIAVVRQTPLPSRRCGRKS